MPLVRLPLVCLLLVRLLLVRLLLVRLLRPVAYAFDVRRGFISSPRILRQRGSWPLGIIVILLRSGNAPGHHACDEVSLSSACLGSANASGRSRRGFWILWAI